MNKTSYPLYIIVLAACTFFYTQTKEKKETVTIAILAKDKGHCLPLFLECIEKQTWPKDQTYIYIRTNNNNDNTQQVLADWVERVKDDYCGIYFDATDVQERVQDFKPHEWNYERFKVLGAIRNASLDWAYNKQSHYFVVDCDNFILPHTLSSMIQTRLPIVAPLLLHGYTYYSNFHADIDPNGYYKDSPFYMPLISRQIKGIVEVPVVHCTYFIRNEYLPLLSYDDNSCRYEYVIFSDSARKQNISQYIDTRSVYGYLTNSDTATDLVSENWVIDFCAQLY